MEHAGIVVDDLAAATAFFVELGLKLQGEWLVEGGWVDRIGEERLLAGQARRTILSAHTAISNSSGPDRPAPRS
jgi:catechol 2,3-dioxygenase-like lactoylglutathione lyase family enzyme